MAADVSCASSGARPGWRVALGLLMIGLIGFTVAQSRTEIAAAARAVRSADPRWLLVLGVALAGWWCAWIAAAALCRRVAGLAVRGTLRSLSIVVLGSIALNSTIKSGGLAGLAAHTADARRRGFPPAPVKAGYLLGAGVADAGFSAVLAIAFAVMLVRGQLTAMDAAALVVFGAVLVAKVAMVVTAARSPRALRRILAGAAAMGQWMRRVVLRRSTAAPAAASAAADELIVSLQLVLSRPRAALAPLTAGILINIAGVIMLWASIAAVGAGSRPVTALVVYSISALFGMVGFLPGGIGFVEVGAAAGLVGAGVALPQSVAAVAIFRVAEFWIPLLAGGLALLVLGRRVPDRTPG